MKNMQTLRVIVELPVEGDFTEHDLRFVVENLLGGGARLHTEMLRYSGRGRIRTGRFRVKSWGRVAAAKKKEGRFDPYEFYDGEPKL